MPPSDLVALVFKKVFEAPRGLWGLLRKDLMALQTTPIKTTPNRNEGLI